MNVFRLFFAVSWTAGPAIASWVMLRYDFVGMFLVAALCFPVYYHPARFRPGHPAAADCPGGARADAAAPVLVRVDILAYFVSFALLFAAGTMG